MGRRGMNPLPTPYAFMGMIETVAVVMQTPDIGTCSAVAELVSALSVGFTAGYFAGNRLLASRVTRNEDDLKEIRDRINSGSVVIYREKEDK